MLNNDFVHSRFLKHFDGLSGQIYFAPGRINLIGEHTDYNGGFVFPAAIDKGITAELRPNGLNTIICYSIDMKDKVEFAVDDPQGPRTTWARYIYGVVQEMRRLGVDVKGFNTAVAGAVPIGAGMASSAGLECCYAYALNDIFGNQKLSKWDMAFAGQATEHKYLGVNCGIMDQFASFFGMENNLIRLNCTTQEHTYFDFNPKEYRLVLLNTGVKHVLVGSPYNERRESCERVAEAIAARYPQENIKLLCDCSTTQVDEVHKEVGEVDYKRAMYVLKENGRIYDVSEKLQSEQYDQVGQYMYDSHEGLSKEYEVSCEELDFLVDIAKECGVAGSRMMGAGFGGCTINLVKDEVYTPFITTAREKYASKFGKFPTVIDVHTASGAHRIG